MTDESKSADHDSSMGARANANANAETSADADNVAETEAKPQDVAATHDLTFVPVERPAQPVAFASSADAGWSAASTRPDTTDDSAAQDKLDKLEKSGTSNEFSEPDASADMDADDVDSGLARLDPLTVHPRRSSVVLCAVFGIFMMAAAAGVWWLAVRTATGQSYDDMVFNNFDALLPSGVRTLMKPFLISKVVIGISVAIGALAVVVIILRKRWWLIGQSLAFVAVSYAMHFLKYVLPRSILVNTVSNPANSAPSGHVLLAAAAGLLLVLAVPRVWRALACAVTSCFAIWIGMSVLVGRWHRPSDVVMALLLIGGLALLILAFTRTSGMDAPGSRFSSASVQIVASVMLTFGVLGVAYAGYIIWQIEPGLELGAQWAIMGATVSAGVLIVAVAALVFSMVLTMRQLTAAPLTRLGLVGAPPAPPVAR